MKVNNKQYQTIWPKEKDNRTIQIINQLYLPYQFIIEDLKNVDDVYEAILHMKVRGAPLIGVAAAFGMYLAVLNLKHDSPSGPQILSASNKLLSSRPTAINLSYSIDLVIKEINAAETYESKVNAAFSSAMALLEKEKEYCREIGLFGLPLIEEISKQKKEGTVNILTHCNAGWLACVDYGTATAPIYFAHDKGIKVHVWVDETRPRNQGAKLTAWELGQHGVPYTVITDNAGGHLMQHGMVDMVITGSDRTTSTGDVANKIGTYLKALAAYDNHIPFYVALPSSSIDWSLNNGIKQIPIEQRSHEEVKFMEGWNNGQIEKILLTPPESVAANYGFDVTPARLISGLITEKGICKASSEGLFSLFPEKNTLRKHPCSLKINKYGHL